MQAIGKWLVGAVLGWLLNLITSVAERYAERKRLEREREETNKKNTEKYENAETREDRVDAAEDLLNGDRP